MRADLETMTDEELRAHHGRLLRLQKQDLDAGHTEGARRIAYERNDAWKEAQRRDVSLEA